MAVNKIIVLRLIGLFSIFTFPISQATGLVTREFTFSLISSMLHALLVIFISFWRDGICALKELQRDRGL
ncbi:hypothetical protein V1507DRAFT_468547 [Lipomyces tetrasporus]